MALPFRYLRRPVSGSYMPFAMGRRSCMGKKFAQIEFSLVLAVLFEHHRIELAQLPGESIGASRERAWSALRACNCLITMQLKESIPVVFVSRR